jgi:hypothetical protein
MQQLLRNLCLDSEPNLPEMNPKIERWEPSSDLTPPDKVKILTFDKTF